MPGRRFLKALIIAALCILAIAFLVRVTQNRMVFFPVPYPYGDWFPENYGLQPRDYFFETRDGLQLHGWHLTLNNSVATLLLFHGNAGNISHRLPLVARFLDELPADVFIFDYRGYGRSEGSPTEAGLYLDAEAAYRFLVDSLGICAERIILHGRSLGGAAAIDLATRVSAAGLLLESTFTNARDMGREMFPLVPLWLFSTLRFDNIGKIRHVTQPVLILHGRRDRIVPFALGQKLFTAAPEPKSFVVLPAAGHNDIHVAGGSQYFAAIRDFIYRCVAPAGRANH